LVAHPARAGAWRTARPAEAGPAPARRAARAAADVVDVTDPGRRDEWRRELEASALNRPAALRAETFLLRWHSFSQPVAASCTDGEVYIVKGQQAGRAIVNDQILARLGVALGAPIGQPAIIDITDLRAVESELQHMPAGTCHGTLRIPDCSDRLWVEHVDEPLNRERFARLAVLYGWGHADDQQLIYPNQPPHLVYSVDHGHFFPGGPEWTVDRLEADGPGAIYGPLVTACSLKQTEIDEALVHLDQVTEADIIGAVASPPDEWKLSLDERVALVAYFVKRRSELLGP
jgi:hypothetical protein